MMNDEYYIELKKHFHIEDYLDWKLIKDENDIFIYNYNDTKINIPAIKVVKIDTLNYLFLKKAITNIANHPNFMQDSYLVESDSINSGETIFYNYENTYFYETYQSLDLPFIADRHYIARSHIIETNESIRINWELLAKNKHSKYLESKNAKNKIFIEDGFGSWKLEKINNNLTKVTYSIYLNPKGWIPSFIIHRSNIYVIPNTVNNMINEGKRLQLLN